MRKSSRPLSAEEMTSLDIGEALGRREPEGVRVGRLGQAVHAVVAVAESTSSIARLKSCSKEDVSGSVAVSVRLGLLFLEEDEAAIFAGISRSGSFSVYLRREFVGRRLG